MPTAASKKKMETAPMDPADREANPREFIRLLMENERRICAYIRTLLGNTADAEDVPQETSMILWDKFSEFDQSSNFVACTANPQWLFHYGSAMKELGRKSEANVQFKKIINGKWAPGLQNWIDQARNEL